eukprot:jgi/Hompol1/2091/HPOL_003557-RA
MAQSAMWPVIKAGYLVRKNASSPFAPSPIPRTPSPSPSPASSPLPLSLPPLPTVTSPPLPAKPNGSTVPGALWWATNYVEVRGLYMFFYLVLEAERSQDLPQRDDDAAAASGAPTKPDTTDTAGAGAGAAGSLDESAPPKRFNIFRSSSAKRASQQQHQQHQQQQQQQLSRPSSADRLARPHSIIHHSSLTASQKSAIFLDVVVPRDVLDIQWRLRDLKHASLPLEEIEEKLRLSELRDWAMAIAVTGGHISESELEKIKIPQAQPPNTSAIEMLTKRERLSTGSHRPISRAGILSQLSRHSFNFFALSRKKADTGTIIDAQRSSEDSRPHSPPAAEESSSRSRPDSPGRLSGLSHKLRSVFPSGGLFGRRTEKDQDRDTESESIAQQRLAMHQLQLKEFERQQHQLQEQQKKRRQRKALFLKSDSLDTKSMPIDPTEKELPPTPNAYARLHSYVPDIPIAIDAALRIVPSEPTLVIKTNSVQFQNQFMLSQRSQLAHDLIPLALSKCIAAIEDLGLHTEGLYRVPGTGAAVDRLHAQFEANPQGTELMRPLAQRISTGGRHSVDGRSLDRRSILVGSMVAEPPEPSLGAAPTDGASIAEEFSSKRSTLTRGGSLDLNERPRSLARYSSTRTASLSDIRRARYNLSLFDDDVHVLASLVKGILRTGLGPNQQPLCTFALYKIFMRAGRFEDLHTRLVAIQDVVHMLPDQHFATLDLLCKHLGNVAAHCESTRMTAHNLAIIFAPTLFREPPELKQTLSPREISHRTLDDMPVQVGVVELLIEYAQWVFAAKETRRDVGIGSKESASALQSDETLPPDGDHEELYLEHEDDHDNADMDQSPPRGVSPTSHTDGHRSTLAVIEDESG